MELYLFKKHLCINFSISSSIILFITAIVSLFEKFFLKTIDLDLIVSGIFFELS